MIWFILWTSVLGTIWIVHQLPIREWIYQALHNKVGLDQIDNFEVSIQHYRLEIYLKGVRIIRDNNSTTSSLPRKLSLPVSLLYRFVSFVSIHIDDLIIEKDNLLIQFDHIYLNSSLSQEFVIRVQGGPCRFLSDAKPLLDMTTISLLTISCPAKSFSLKYVKLDIQIGQTVVHATECKQLLDNNRRTSSSQQLAILDDVLNSVRVTVQSICFILPTLKFEIQHINSVIARRDHTPLLQFNTEEIKCLVFNVEVFRVASMEIRLSQLDGSTALYATPPQTDFFSLTWIFNSPVIQIPLNCPDVMNFILGKKQKSSPSTITMVLEKAVADLPVCTFALVLDSPKLQFSELEGKCGYISSESLIIRVSGEYVVKARNNSVYDVPSSSSSSDGSNLDALFAQEEYQWLRKSSHARPRKLLNLMGRVSRRDVPIVTTTPTQRWSYRISGKIMIQKLNLGYTESQLDHEFLRIKDAVLMFKMRMHVLLDSLETVLNMENCLQSEIAIDKPVIYLTDPHTISPCIFWLKQIPAACFKKDSEEPVETEKPVWMDRLIRNTSFSLDVTKGSIITRSLDRSHQDQGVAVPTPHPGYIDNTPLHTVSSCLILDTQKFNFVCEGPGTGTEWKIRCYLDKLDIRQSSGDDEKLHVIVWISQVNLSAKLNLLDNLSRCLSVSTKIRKYGIRYSVRNHYASLLMAKSILALKQQFKSTTPNEHEIDPELPLYMEFDMHIARGDIHFLLPMDAQLYIRLDNLILNYESTADAPTASLRNFMLLGVSPADPEAWEQLIEVDKVNLNITKNVGIELKARKFFISVPYNYKLSFVLDKVIGAIKAIKVLHSRILTRKAFKLFGPTINNAPVLIPCILIKTRLFTIHFDDDPFEAKLRTILRTGLVEQQKRLAYEDALNEKINEMMLSSDDPFIHDQIAEAQQNLLGYFSQLWIKNLNEKKREEKEFYEQLHLQDYRNSASSHELDISLDEVQRQEADVFMIAIRARPLYPPLANFSAQFTKINFRPADFPVSETRQFIHTMGGGVPLDNNFSIIIPFHISIKAGQTWIKVRDYPLPLLYVPPPQYTLSGGNSSRLSWSLEGNYAVGDELGNSGGSRIIPIPIITASSKSPGYCLSAVRTASPLKFYSVIDYDIYTPSMSTICWSVSYNPAIQDILLVLESLVSDQVDPSPKLGFWDKVRFMIHTQTKFNFIGGGDLGFIVKGTRDPYQLKGRGAGLAKIWSDEVVWMLGYKNDENEFMQILSKNYAFGVPDLAGAEYVPDLPDSLMAKKNVEKTSKFLKVVLKLSDGIRMGIGLSYERLKYCLDCEQCTLAHRSEKCRTQVFSPHYNVIYQSVQQVNGERYYDAFRGFRSDFIHLSLSIVHSGQDSEDTSYNAMYISPCYIEHFTHWYQLLGSPVSIPIRQGPLFPRAEAKSKSFGEHLNTIKYKFVINPLTIGFFCTDEEAYFNVKGGGSAGLKANVRAFSVDLHQRRDKPVEVTLAKKTPMVFHEVEVELHEIDLRVIRKSFLPTKSTDTATLSDATTSLSDEEERLSQWMDPNDYIILEPTQQENRRRTKVEAHPFVFSPLFYYVKQQDETGTEKREYLRGTHDCIMGKGMEAHAFQKTHLQRRASDLDVIIEEHDKQLDLVLNAVNTIKHEQDKQALHNQYTILLEKLNYLRTNRYMLHTYLAQFILDTELSMNRSDNDVSPTTSSLNRQDELTRWETLMGHFTDRFFLHNPQIIWNNSVRDAIYYWQDIKNKQSVQAYNLSSRCLKFFEDLVHTAEKQQQWKPDVPSTTHQFLSDTGATQDLIDKLLSERSHHYVAYNEKEEEKSKDDFDGTYVFDCVNDPDYQYKNIPEFYEMKSKYLIDMMNPQVNFQSEKGLDHLILFTNERIHVKAFSIIDNSSGAAADKDVRLVKDRILVSLDNAQLLVAKRMEFLSTDLLTQSSYGQRKLHWTAWVQPEQLWYYKDVTYFDNFQRVASNLSGTIQLDRYNHLRIKINKYNTSRKSPFEDRTNTLQLHFPHVKLTLNSQQGHILYYTLTNLLLGNDDSPRKKERAARFRDVMLAAERSDLAETVKQVGVLQHRSRILLDLHKRFMQEIPRLDPLGLRELNKNRKKMRENLEKLYLVVEAIRSIQTFRRDIHLEETDNAMRFSFTTDEIIWEAILDDQSSLCQWILMNTKYVFLDKQNGSSKNTIEVDQMRLVNTTKSPVFTNVLDVYLEPGQSRQKMLRGVLESLPPVGGIPVIQQLEINLVPLHLQISTAFGTMIKDYFFPRIEPDDLVTEERQEDSEEDEDEENMSVDGLDVKSSLSETSSLHSVDTKTFHSTLSKREGSFASFDVLTQKVKESVRGKRKSKSDELTVMKKRSSSNYTFIYVRIPATRHCLSLQGPSQTTIYNLYNFPFKQPKLEYRNKTWSIAEMMEEMQRQFMRAIVRHSPALLKNKLMMTKQPVIEGGQLPPMTRSIRSVKSAADFNAVVKKSKENEKLDHKSLYSNDDAEEEVQRLAELQTVNRRMSFNVDQELLDVYLKRYRQEELLDEKIQKGRILFGDAYTVL